LHISAGALNNPIIYTRAAGGTAVSQLITEFGYTTNLVASSRLQAKADEQNALATKESILLAVDQASYNALQTHAVLRVAEQTVASRQLTADQVSALTKSKLKSELDLSFANVNLAQAKLLYLDALNNDKAAMAGLAAILGYSTVQNFDLAEDAAPLMPPPPDVDELITQAFSDRPEILSLEFQAQSAEKLHKADRDQLFPIVSALGAIGDAPFRDDRITGVYATAGVNVQIRFSTDFSTRQRPMRPIFAPRRPDSACSTFAIRFRAMCAPVGSPLTPPTTGLASVSNCWPSRTRRSTWRRRATNSVSAQLWN